MLLPEFHTMTPEEALVMKALPTDLIDAILEAFMAGLTRGGKSGLFPRAYDIAHEYAAMWAGDKIVTRLADEDFNEPQLIDASTRAEVKSLVDQAIQDGWSVNELQEALARGPFGQERALRIAHTETIMTYNRGASMQYLAEGYSFVRVYDGNGCERCRAANGQVWTVENAAKFPIGHPHCDRDFSPLDPKDDEKWASSVATPHADELAHWSRVENKSLDFDGFIRRWKQELAA